MMLKSGLNRRGGRGLCRRAAACLDIAMSGSLMYTPDGKGVPLIEMMRLHPLRC